MAALCFSQKALTTSLRPMPKKSGLHLQGQPQRLAGIRPKDIRHAAAAAIARMPRRAARIALDQATFLHAPAAMEIGVIFRAFLASWSLHRSILN
jgi:hypothetical protein